MLEKLTPYHNLELQITYTDWANDLDNRSDTTSYSFIFKILQRQNR